MVYLLQDNTKISNKKDKKELLGVLQGTEASMLESYEDGKQTISDYNSRFLGEVTESSADSMFMSEAMTSEIAANDIDSEVYFVLEP